jgi:ribosomal protein S18 acetylase RimI-like enzyme
VIAVRAARVEDADACVGVLAALPGYFTPDTHDATGRAIRSGAAAWVAVDDGGEVVGFVLVERPHRRAAEITYAAVLLEHHGRGIGRALVDQAVASLAAAGVVLVVVKTLDASADYEPYVATRAFWERRGFVQVDMIDPLPGWQPGNPAAIYVAALEATR